MANPILEHADFLAEILALAQEGPLLAPVVPLSDVHWHVVRSMADATDYAYRRLLDGRALGGMGEVWEAEHTLLRRTVAITIDTGMRSSPAAECGRTSSSKAARIRSRMCGGCPAMAAEVRTVAPIA